MSVIGNSRYPNRDAPLDTYRRRATERRYAISLRRRSNRNASQDSWTSAGETFRTRAACLKLQLLRIKSTAAFLCSFDNIISPLDNAGPYTRRPACRL